MVSRDPYEVLGVEPGASAAVVKAAWRRLARAHHPDLAVDAASKRAATRRMAEINAAYEALRRRPGTTRARSTAAPGTPNRSDDRAAPHPTAERPSGPPPPPPTRPVTARLDTTELFRPRNATTTPHGNGYRHYPRGHDPRPNATASAEPPRASTPSGPAQPAEPRRVRRRRPTLEAARQVEITFGKFHGMTLAEIAAREPSYLSWVARTIARDPDLVAAARVLLADLGVEVGSDQGARTAEPVAATSDG